MGKPRGMPWGHHAHPLSLRGHPASAQGWRGRPAPRCGPSQSACWVGAAWSAAWAVTQTLRNWLLGAWPAPGPAHHPQLGDPTPSQAPLWGPQWRLHLEPPLLLGRCRPPHVSYSSWCATRPASETPTSLASVWSEVSKLCPQTPSQAPPPRGAESGGHTACPLSALGHRAPSWLSHTHWHQPPPLDPACWPRQSPVLRPADSPGLRVCMCHLPSQGTELSTVSRGRAERGILERTHFSTLVRL